MDMDNMNTKQFAGYGQNDANAASAPKTSAPLSFLRPTNSFGEPVLPSYTRYVNNAVSSFNHPLHSLFADRRQSPMVPSTLYGNKTSAPQGGM